MKWGFFRTYHVRFLLVLMEQWGFFWKCSYGGKLRRVFHLGSPRQLAHWTRRSRAWYSLRSLKSVAHFVLGDTFFLSDGVYVWQLGIHYVATPGVLVAQWVSCTLLRWQDEAVLCFISLPVIQAILILKRCSRGWLIWQFRLLWPSYAEWEKAWLHSGPWPLLQFFSSPMSICCTGI